MRECTNCNDKANPNAASCIILFRRPSRSRRIVLLSILATVLCQATWGEPTSRPAQRIQLLGRSYSPTEAIAQLAPLLDDQDVKIQIQALYAAGSLTREYELPAAVRDRIEALLESESKKVQEAAGCCLYWTPRLEPSERIRKALHSPNITVRFYAASALLHGAGARKDLNDAVECLLDIIKLAPDIDPRAVRMIDKDKSNGVISADNELRKLVQADATYPPEKNIPLDSMRDMSAAEVKKLMQDCSDEIASWWREHGVSAIDAIAKRNSEAAALKK